MPAAVSCKGSCERGSRQVCAWCRGRTGVKAKGQATVSELPGRKEGRSHFPSLVSLVLLAGVTTLRSTDSWDNLMLKCWTRGRAIPHAPSFPAVKRKLLPSTSIPGGDCTGSTPGSPACLPGDSLGYPLSEEDAALHHTLLMNVVLAVVTVLRQMRASNAYRPALMKCKETFV